MLLVDLLGSRTINTFLLFYGIVILRFIIMRSFNVNATSIDITIQCLCGIEIEETIQDLPNANYSANSVSDSENSEEYLVCCECGEKYTCNVYINMYEGNIEVKDENGADVDFDFREQYDDLND